MKIGPLTIERPDARRLAPPRQDAPPEAPAAVPPICAADLQLRYGLVEPARGAGEEAIAARLLLEGWVRRDVRSSPGGEVDLDPEPVRLALTARLRHDDPLVRAAERYIDQRVARGIADVAALGAMAGLGLLLLSMIDLRPEPLAVPWTAGKVLGFAGLGLGLGAALRASRA